MELYIIVTCLAGVLCGVLSAPASLARKDPLEYFVVEELPAKTPISDVAIDALYRERYDTSVMKMLSYRFVNDDPLMYLFEIDEKTSILTISRTIDRDEVCEKDVRCLVRLHVGVSPPQYADTIKILVEILDANDHRPEFPETRIKIQTSEDVALGTSWPLPMAHDVDSGKNGRVHYELGTENPKFQLITTIDSTNVTMDVRLKVVQPLDRETESSYALKVIAYDGGIPPRSGSVVVDITVDDINDNNPKFYNSTYEFFIIENAPAGTPVGVVKAEDKDLGPNGQLVYAFSNQTKETHGHLFGIVNTSGVIYQKVPLDFETGSTYLLAVIAHDMGINSQPSHANVIVRVEDDNDNAPKITLNALGTPGVVNIPASTEGGAIVATITVSDQDGGDNGKVQCDLNDNHFAVLEVYQSEYRVVTRHAMTSQLGQQHELTIVCHDLGRKPKVTMSSLIVRIHDANDHPPRFNQSIYVSHLGENNKVNEPVLQVYATDIDDGSYGEVKYKLHTDAQDNFRINTDTGLISANSVFDYERSQEYTFRVIAFDMGSPSLSATATVHINILDTNDDKVHFKQNSYEFGVFENMPVRSEVGEVGVQEFGDVELPGLFTFSVANPNTEDAGSFSVNPVSGIITTTAVLDRERQPVYYLSVMATNEGYPPMTGSVSVTIYVADKNDHDPLITYPNPANNTVYLSTHAPVGYTAARVLASDKDIGENGKLAYFISRGNEAGAFTMNIATGVLTVAKYLTTVAQGDYDLTIDVRDQGFPKRISRTRLNIIVNGSIVFTPEVTGSEAVISDTHATIVVAATASILIVVFIILFAVMMYLVWKRLGPKLRHGSSNDLTGHKRYSNVSERTLWDDGGYTFERDRGTAEGGEAEPPAAAASPRIPVAAGSAYIDNEHNSQLERKPSNIQSSQRMRHKNIPQQLQISRQADEESPPGSPPRSPMAPTPPPPYSAVCNLRASPSSAYATNLPVDLLTGASDESLIHIQSLISSDSVA